MAGEEAGAVRRGRPVARRDRRLVPVTVALVLVACGVMAWWVYTPERLLDGQGQRLWPRSDHNGNRWTIRGSAWLSDTEAWEFTKDSSSFDVSLAVLDTRSGSRHDLKALSKKANTALADLGVSGVIDCYPSPNRRWIMCWGARSVYTGNSQQNYRRFQGFAALTLDGSRLLRWPEIEAAGFSLQWLPDGETFVLLAPSEAVLFNLDRPGIVIRKAISTLPPIMWSVDTRPDGSIAMVTPGRDHVTESVVFHTVSVHTDPPRSWKEKVRLPFHCKVQSVDADDSGRRILWHLVFDEKSPTMPILAPLLRRFGLTGHPRSGIWVSRMDGSEMREIGHVHDRELGDVRWLPGGKSITYHRKRVYYRLAVP
jgi:hypothetical protein